MYALIPMWCLSCLYLLKLHQILVSQAGIGSVCVLVRLWMFPMTGCGLICSIFWPSVSYMVPSYPEVIASVHQLIVPGCSSIAQVWLACFACPIHLLNQQDLLHRTSQLWLIICCLFSPARSASPAHTWSACFFWGPGLQGRTVQPWSSDGTMRPCLSGWQNSPCERWTPATTPVCQ